MQVHHVCFNEFPDQCAGCPDYSETMSDQSSQLLWLIGTGMVYPPPFTRRIIKECRRFHKRKVEYLK